MSSPFKNKAFTFTQPDGTHIKQRGWGDQNYAVFETLDGYTVMKNPSTGFYEIAQVSSDGTELESAHGPQGNLDSTFANVHPGVRINRDAARARGMEAALRMGSRRCDQRREQRKSLTRSARMLDGPVMAPPERETVGDFVGLCLLIDFSDEPGVISRQEVEDFCNQPGDLAITDPFSTISTTFQLAVVAIPISSPTIIGPNIRNRIIPIRTFDRASVPGN